MKLTIPLQDRSLDFKLYPIGTIFSRIAGIYTFFIIPNQQPIGEPDYHPSSDEKIDGFYNLLYLGITNNFSTRLKAHHKIAQAQQQGMTHIGIHKMRSGRKRKSTERQLLKAYNPALNQTWL